MCPFAVLDWPWHLPGVSGTEDQGQVLCTGGLVCEARKPPQTTVAMRSPVVHLNTGSILPVQEWMGAAQETGEAPASLPSLLG